MEWRYANKLYNTQDKKYTIISMRRSPQPYRFKRKMCDDSHVHFYTDANLPVYNKLVFTGYVM